jgi:hypothetical protein
MRRIHALSGAFIFAAVAAVSCYAADEPVAAVRAGRAESNAAIAAHDAARLRPLFHDDYHGIRGSTGNVTNSAEEAVRLFAQDVFPDPTFITYQRTPDNITLSGSGKRVAESGTWTGTWRKPDGIAKLSGIYLAMWTPKDGVWRLKSESFVTLSCVGSDACKTLD